MTQNDPELGPVRWCETCQEWWPDDAEFWRYYVQPAGSVVKVHKGRAYLRKSPSRIVRCRGCWEQRQRERAQAAAVPHKCLHRACPVWLPAGRRLCHSHAHRPTVPMTPALLRELSTGRPLNPWINAFPSRARGA